MIFMAVVYILCIVYILNKYYSRKEYAVALPKVAFLLPMALITLAFYFAMELLIDMKVVKNPKFKKTLGRTMDKLEAMIKNEY